MFTAVSDMCQKYGWTYYHVAHEICPTTGSDHMDGYYELQTQRKISTENKKFTKVFGPGFGDLQVAKGTAAENCDYSEKEGRKMETRGQPGQGQGERSDLRELKEDIMSGKRSVDDIAVAEPEAYHQYGRTLTKLEDIALRKKFRTEMPVATWVWGPTGVGKSHWLNKDYDPERMYTWKDDNGWQDGYAGQPIVLINEFRGGIPFNELLQLIDKWPYFIRRRGREPAPMLATEFRITSSMPPSQVYHGIASREDGMDSMNQLYRRVRVLEVPNRMAGEILL